jgi:hypothetical protein
MPRQTAPEARRRKSDCESSGTDLRRRIGVVSPTAPECRAQQW